MKATLLIFGLIFGIAAASAQEVPAGKLGHPLGTYLRIEGVRADGFKTGGHPLLGHTINGKKREKPIAVWVENVESLLTEGRCILRGYETGRMIGTPPAEIDAAREAGKEMSVPQAAWQFRRYFIVKSVVEPKSLKLQ